MPIVPARDTVMVFRTTMGELAALPVPSWTRAPREACADDGVLVPQQPVTTWKRPARKRRRRTLRPG